MFTRKYSLIIFITVLLTTLQTTTYAQEQAEMNVHFIDVGQGDSILIQTPSNKNILIDGGPPEAGKKVVSYLKDHNINNIDLLIATHPDIDHIGGLLHVMQKIKVNQLIDSGKFYTTRTYTKYINQIHQQKIPMITVKQNERIHIDPLLHIQVLNAYERKKNNNQSSIVLKVQFNDISFLFMSDVENKQEKKMIEKYDLQADFVKIAHHGSRTSSSLPFLQAVNPEVALITYSKENDYGHPVSQVIKNLDRLNTMIYSTAVYGDIMISTDGTSYFIHPDKSPIDGLLESTT